MGEGYRAADAEARAVAARTEAVRMRAETAKVKTMARTWVEAARTRAKVAGLENCRSLQHLQTLVDQSVSRRCASESKCCSL